MAVKTWNAGTAGNWNVSGNWSPAGVPANGDDVVFDGTSTYDCTIDVNTNNLDSFLMDTNYTGKVSLGSFTLQVENTGDGSDFTGTEGEFDAGTGLIKVSGDWDTSSVNFTFTRGTSNVDLTGTGNVSTRDTSTYGFYDLTCGATGKTTTILIGATDGTGASNTLTIGTGIIAGAKGVYLRGLITPLVNNGTISCPIFYAGNDDQPVLATTYGSTFFIVLTVAGKTATMQGNVTVGASAYIHGDAPGIMLDTAGFSLTVGSHLYLTPPWIPAAVGILIATSSTIDCGDDVIIDNASSYITCTTATWTVAGDWTSVSTHASFDMGTSTVTFDGGVTQNITTNGDAFHAIETSGAGTIGYQKDDLECYTLEIGADTTWEIDAVSEAVALALKFTDLADCGFKDTSEGTFLCQGDVTNRVTVTTADASPPPTNYWSGDIFLNFVWNLANTTLSYYDYLEFRTASSTLSDVTLDHVEHHAIYSYVSISKLYNVAISNAAINDVWAIDTRLEFTYSNFDTSNVALSTTGNIISDRHNDIANNYQIMATTLSKSIITNDFVATDNCELVLGTLTIDESAAFNDFDIDSGAELTINAGEAVTVTAGGTVTNNGTITAVGASGSLIELLSGTPGTVWNLNNQGVFTPQYVGVRDSDASSGNEIDASDGTNFDGGNNTNWKFEYSPIISNPSVTPTSGSLTDYYTISCEFATVPDYAYVTVGNAIKEMEISGTIGLVKFHGSKIGILSSGTITIVAVKGAESDSDTSLTLTITDTEDVTNLIRDTIANELRDKTGSGQWFQNFTIYEHPQISSGWSTPCIEMEMLREPTTPYLLGNERLDTITMMFYLIFKRSHKRTISGTLKEMDELSNWYLERLKDTLNEVTWPSSINIDSAEIIGNTHKEPDSIEKLYLYGCEVHVIIRYKGGIT